VFVGGLDPNVTEDELKQSFSQYGEIASVKIPVGKQCGFVQFVQRYNPILCFIHGFKYRLIDIYQQYCTGFEIPNTILTL